MGSLFWAPGHHGFRSLLFLQLYDKIQLLTHIGVTSQPY